MHDAVQSLVVFDIETYAPPADKIDPQLLQAATRHCQNDAERQDQLSKLGLSPATGEVACVGLFDYVRVRPGLFYRSDLGNIDKLAPVIWKGHNADIQLHAKANERELLAAVWGVLEKFDCLVTFNGRSFDYPFLMQRSFLLNVPVQRHLFANRYKTDQHFDLCDYLSGFGSSRRMSLDLLSRAAGLVSPKDDGLDGSKVSSAIDAGQLKAVGDYCMRDVMTTAALANRAFNVFGDDLRAFALFSRP